MVGVDDGAQALLHRALQPTTEKRQTDEPQASFLSVPAQVVEQLGFGFVAETLQRSGEVVRLELIAEPGDTAILQQIFHTGMTTDAAIAVIPLQRHDCLEKVEDVSGVHVAKGIGDARERFLFVVGAAHAAPHVDVAAPQIAGGVGEGHQTDVLGQQIHRVVTGDGDGHLELSGQVGVAIERFRLTAGEHAWLQLTLAGPANRGWRAEAIAEVAVHPEVEIRTFSRFRTQQIGNLVGQPPCSGVATFFERGRRGHHVAVDVTTGRQGGTQVANDGADHLFQVGLGNAVHLEGLPGGRPQGAVPQPVGELVEGEKQLGRNAATGAAQPQHHLPGLVFPLLAFIAVVLLIAAVELEDLQSVFAEIGQIIRQFAQQRLPQVVAVQLALFRFRKTGCGLLLCSCSPVAHALPVLMN